VPVLDGGTPVYGAVRDWLFLWVRVSVGTWADEVTQERYLDLWYSSMLNILVKLITPQHSRRARLKMK
jgi:hypothetical protein